MDDSVVDGDAPNTKGPLVRWVSPQGELAEDGTLYREVEITFVTATKPRVDNGRLLDHIQGILGARRDNWPKWLLAIEVDGIYEEDEEDADGHDDPQ